MELRTLRYFLELARRGSFTAAANALNLTQPTLSRQMQELEAEVGAPLLVRGKRRTALTDAGKYLADRAAEILELAERTRNSLSAAGGEIRGDVSIAGGETRAMRLVARAVKKTRDSHPGIRFHIFSGNAEAVSERLEKGLADFGIFVGQANLAGFDHVRLPVGDVWGLLLARGHPLAAREAIAPADLAGVPLLCSAQAVADNELGGWLGEAAAHLEIAATYTLLYNASLLVREGVGAAVCINGIADVSEGSGLVFRPFRPALVVGLALAWKKGRSFSPAATLFRQRLLGEIGGEGGGIQD
ncbi:MAG: LysR family transcriptional regulator [Desulfovibrio sp.]|uniref:LysR family transcriptional regulator n=1 Tax=Desulfovibrio sp. TaxID=885 RepID=UPI001A6DFE9D|nr:LysR family transcriptional regulator [Desulfovibrio sp.]MBD5416921.1 LysR family transcriptional regulator [Desulfovibrio sp.]